MNVRGNKSMLVAGLVILLSIITASAVFAQSTTDGAPQAVKGITPGRAQALIGGALALVSVIIGWRAKSRGNKRTQAVLALAFGGIAIILSVIHLSTSAGAVFGSGSGKAGAIVALLLGLIGTSLSGMAMRSKKNINL